ncbi:MAG: hypothetical protein U0228_01445 [Myxococcaceae bacterium]
MGRFLSLTLGFAIGLLSLSSTPVANELASPARPMEWTAAAHLAPTDAPAESMPVAEDEEDLDDLDDCDDALHEHAFDVVALARPHLASTTADLCAACGFSSELLRPPIG